ncbi:hypothetical protein Pyrde_1421 [Pyrodictium delaneyi]|uniref:ABC transporter domain-containing protein n=1 Tax=Pyrodictium delaneyi TaxID=1273541 RepID=A0A0N7JD82_9CREN|nr:ATP-binding cassette domain-containing protein [Pyrodictium delaneyi]ALL01465.1 hypothetical protein Pyrde_1421 [Pyrodictium delaneyi]OWJ54620.1 hypothetical protein Pdsh_06255 [Pyrodictium delaneyi]
MLEAKIERVAYPRGRIGLENVELKLEPGTVLLVAGPSGSGKSTLLKTLAGVVPFIEEASVEAEIRVRGERLDQLPPGRRPIAYLPQDPGELALGEYGAEVLLFYGAKPRLPLANLLDRRIYEMSSGQLQRLVLSAVTGRDRDIVLLDEPLANLDAESSSQAYNTIRELIRNGVSVVIAEHRLSRVAGLASEMLVLSRGRLVFRGSPEEGLEVAERVGARPVRVSGVSLEKPCSCVEGEPVAGLNKVYVGYSGRLVLQGLDFVCPRGSLMAVVGPNGSGKTTLLKLLAGLMRPWRGRVWYSWGRWDWRMIGYVPSSPWLSFLEESVLDEVASVAHRAGSTTPVEDAIEALELLGLRGYEGEKPWRLSGGEMARLAVARAIVKKPRLLLLDEPLRGQDRRSAEAVLEAARLVARLGGCSVVVTHDLEFLSKFDAVFRLDKGCYLDWPSSS